MKDSEYVKINSVNTWYLSIINSDDSLPLNKALKIYNITIVIRSVFEEDGKYYSQIFLDEFLYEL